MTEQYKIGDRFVIEEECWYNVQKAHGKDVVLVLACIGVNGDGLFIAEEYYSPECDYSSLGAYEIDDDYCEWINLESDNLFLLTTKPATESLSQQIDESLGLVTIPLRLDKELVDKYKVIAYDNRTSIEVLMRNCLEGMSNLFGRK